MQTEKTVLPLAPLEKQGALQILVYLYQKNGKANISEIKRNVKSSTETILSTVELLKALGLAEDIEKATFPFAHLVWLTEKGRKVAELLQEASHFLQGEQHLKRNQDDPPAPSPQTGQRTRLTRS